ncbi:glucosamine--fructose-6-phosphate aminotransferase (isomerizing) [Oribacterium sinus]|uniref:Glutamine--fructose-6-phosphate aminotransferase [isomerizing] n=1 Tax=Oribacterium sinus TaxID=237576 RepID=A0A7W9SEU3_9FIRM|nr:glutamine--fructose-6-phosphate transaminase (isomerizing) [Oribacterium sinus]MBB6040707.1 glucosamine--fructose-6-phosphate aminotransferase (isomerizing) [Oribacterium sinus]
MCGIVGFVGQGNTKDILLAGLSRLEYRGYDSAGIALYSQPFTMVKAVGKLEELKKKVSASKDCQLPYSMGIGHTRWATHGKASEKNAHPHLSMHKEVVLVHNGIIENFAELKTFLQEQGYSFYSDTDTEVAVNLIEYYYRKDKDILKALFSVQKELKGSYAFAIMFQEDAKTLYAMRKDSPLIVGKGENAFYLASDVSAFLDYTNEIYPVENREILSLSEKEIHIYNKNGEEVKRSSTIAELSQRQIHKGEYLHFMEKEIFEQPKVVKDTLLYACNQENEEPAGNAENPKFSYEAFSMTEKDFQEISRVRVIACGSAYHAGWVLKSVCESLARVPVQVELASEFRYNHPILEKGELVISISQSGETADTLAALKEAKKLGAKTLSIVNVKGSAIARESDFVFYTQAGPEIAVATTKAYSCQLAAGYIFSLLLAKAKGKISKEETRSLTEELFLLPGKIQQCLSFDQEILPMAKELKDADNIFFLGRGLDWAISMEGALKLKEISYIHCESYSSGELKHGTISLIEKGSPVIGLLSQEELAGKSISNIHEVRSRGAKCFAIRMEDIAIEEEDFAHNLIVPKTHPLFAGSLLVLPLQFLSYQVSLLKGFDPDKPRNLAKSVTVE